MQKTIDYAYNTLSVWFTLLLLFRGTSADSRACGECGRESEILLEPKVELIKNEGIKPKDLKKAKTLCETFQEDFIEKWHEHMDDEN